MSIVNFTPLNALAGGILLGLSTAILMIFNGKISGVSGITKGIISKNCPSPQERRWRIFFVIGLIGGGIIINQFLPSMTAKAYHSGSLQVIISGLLVGTGTALGNGCTSGHGICGLGRRSPRSLASVLTFMGTGILTVFIFFHIFNFGT